MPENDARRWWEERRRRDREAAAKMSAEHFAQPDATIPDLSFDTPKCPICLEHTEYDDGQYICDVCAVVWPSNGYGSEAYREPPDRPGAGQ